MYTKYPASGVTVKVGVGVSLLTGVALGISDGSVVWVGVMVGVPV